MIVLGLFGITLLVSLVGTLVKTRSGLNEMLLRFSGAFFLTMVFTHYLPESYLGGPSNVGIWVIVGFLLQVILAYFTKGVEHGHAHSHQLFGFSLWFALVIHSLVEGAALEVTGSNAWFLGIIVHKMPVAFFLGWILKRESTKAYMCWLFLGFFAAATPLGYLISVAFDLSQFEPQVTALSAGLLMHVSTVILFEGNQNHHFNLKQLIIILLGIGVALVL